MQEANAYLWIPRTVDAPERETKEVALAHLQSKAELLVPGIAPVIN